MFFSDVDSKDRVKKKGADWLFCIFSLSPFQALREFRLTHTKVIFWIKVKDSYFEGNPVLGCVH